jgi:hypothetical protein
MLDKVSSSVKKIERLDQTFAFSSVKSGLLFLVSVPLFLDSMPILIK